MFPNQTPEQPAPSTPPTPPQPIQPPVEPLVAPSAPEPTPVTPPTPEPVTPNPFGAATSSQPTPPTGLPVDPAPTTPPKKPVNKKLIAILIAVIVLLGLAAVAYFVVLPMFNGSKSNGGTGTSNSGGSSSNKLDLTAKSGDGFTISVPSAYKLVPSDSTTAVQYTEDGTNTAGVPSVAVFKYDGTVAASIYSVYSNPIADTVVSKGYTFEKAVYSGAEAVQGKGIRLKDGKEISTDNSFVIKKGSTTYIVSVSVPIGDKSGLEDEVSAIFSSFSIK